MLGMLASTHFRGIWIPRWSIPDKQKIIHNLDGRFNHLFLQVFANGEAYYPSRIAPVKLGSDKWLTELIAEAHRRNIKVSAWVNVFYSWGYAKPLVDPRHPMNFAPEWYLCDRSSRTMLDYGTGELAGMLIEGYYLAPANQGVRSYIFMILEEIITRYDFDGIHLDYIRYPGSSFAYDKSLRTKFYREFCYDPLDIVSGDLQNRLGAWGYDDLERKWQRFPAEDLSQYIDLLSAMLREIRPSIVLSAAVKPDFRTARDDYSQDWQDWLNSGSLDFVCLMAYDKNIEPVLKRTMKSINEPQRVMVGLGIFNNDPPVTRLQVEFVNKTDFGGIVYFSYEDLKKNREYLEILSK
jgi:uncharacterized lipoprotein YddW (UPF0748 family)